MKVLLNDRLWGESRHRSDRAMIGGFTVLVDTTAIQKSTSERSCGCELRHPEGYRLFIGLGTNEIGTNSILRSRCGERWLPAISDALAKEKSRKGVVGIITSGRDHDTLWDVDPAKGNCV